MIAALSKDQGRARGILRLAIHRYFNRAQPWIGRVGPRGGGQGNPQSFRWSRTGLREAEQWLRNRGVEDPSADPTPEAATRLSAQVLAVWCLFRSQPGGVEGWVIPEM